MSVRTQTYLEFFAQKTHKTTRAPLDGGDHWEIQTAFTLLPKRLLNNHNRPKVVSALQRAIEHFAT